MQALSQATHGELIDGFAAVLHIEFSRTDILQ